MVRRKYDRWVRSLVPAALAASAALTVLVGLYTTYRTFFPEATAYNSTPMPTSLRIAFWVATDTQSPAWPTVVLPVLAVAWLVRSGESWAPHVSHRVRQVSVGAAAVAAALAAATFLATIVWLIVTHGTVQGDQSLTSGYGGFQISPLSTLLGTGATALSTALVCGAVAWLTWVVRPATVVEPVTATGDGTETEAPDDVFTRDPGAAEAVPGPPPPAPVARDLTPFVRPTAPLPTNGHGAPAPEAADPQSIFRRPG